MRKIIIPFAHRWKEDVERIQKVLITRGYECSLENAAFLWDEYSDGMAAGWMTLPEDDDAVFATIAFEVIKYSQAVLTPPHHE